MPYIVSFNVPLTCLTTGARVENPELYTSGLSPEPTSFTLAPGDVIAMTLEDFEDGYYLLRPVREDETTARALERWGCPVCERDHWTLIELERLDDEHVRFTSAKTVPLDPETVETVHAVSNWMNRWLEGHPQPEYDWLLRIMLPVFSEYDREKLRGRLERQ